MTQTARANLRVRLVICSLLALPVATNVASCRDFDADSPRPSGGRGGTPSSVIDGGSAGHDDESNPDPSGGSAGSPRGGGAASGQGGIHPQVVDPGGSGGGAGTDPGISPLPPSAVSGLSLWLESSVTAFDTSQSRISRWKDSSGNGNDAEEFDTALQPTLVANALNGFSTVEFPFKLANLVVADHPSLQFGTDPFTIAVVGEWHNVATPIKGQYGGFGQILAKVEQVLPFNGVVLFANFPQPYADVDAHRRFGVQLEFGRASLLSSSLNLNDGKVRLYVVQRRAAGLLEIRINGAPQGWAEIPPEINTSAPGNDLILGGNVYDRLDGSLAELVMFKGSVSDAELQGVEQYLMEKFGL